MLAYLLFVLGLLGVLAGAQLLVSSSSRLAAMLGVPPIVVGLTIVSFGTSAPEIVISGLASYQGHPETALGNVVGSNIANVGLVLALAAVIYPLRPDRTVLRREGPVMVVISLVFLAVAFTGGYERWHGAVMLAVLAALLVVSLRWSREAGPGALAGGVEIIQVRPRLSVWRAMGQAGYAVVGIGLLFGGGQALVSGAVDIAEQFSVPQFVIASTLVAIGTSVPELATSVVAALRKQADIAVGNIIGSNIFNLLAVLGIASLAGAIPVEGIVQQVDMPVMAAFSIVAVAAARWRYSMTRWEGGALLAAYVLYLSFLLVR